ncbi:16S rRNA (guanine(527)-N(7))-methyltransferase RsmG [Sulfurimonas sp. SAG-AH-194-L11]|nr:16S rRNA (guanine(527)-N(7))-methyltransferase RsmG [Sulfurimonas sp. SAG-AH-194-L11]MDF1876608.1 16S rRNA (guanine(527)-N(7))-methyltransferase RsmG [Sulfurimonas sp. SAG-AH-194-L11]
MDLKTSLLNDNIALPDDFFYNVQKYKEHLHKWNKIHNLTGARDNATLDAFIYDAVFPLSFLPPVSSLMDIGTGAGFPGMILAFGLPDTEVTLVEPLSKRASFLQFIKADLGLKNVKVVKKRVEQMEPQIFDMITSRAVTETKMLLELSKAFCNKDTKFLFYKGEKVFDEVQDGVQNMQHKIIERKNRHYLLLGEAL